VSHTLFTCDAWADKRRRCNKIAEEDIDADNLVRIMLVSQDKWNAINQYINEIMTAKEEEERRREREEI